jgi:hypothetical protein
MRTIPCKNNNIASWKNVSNQKKDKDEKKSMLQLHRVSIPRKPMTTAPMAAPVESLVAAPSNSGAEGVPLGLNVALLTIALPVALIVGTATLVPFPPVG